MKEKETGKHLKIWDVKHVEKVYSQDECNSLLDDNYILLAVETTKDESGCIHTIYILGLVEN